MARWKIVRPLNNPAKYRRKEKYSFQNSLLRIDYLPNIPGVKFESKGRTYIVHKTGAIIRLT